MTRPTVSRRQLLRSGAVTLTTTGLIGSAAAHEGPHAPEVPAESVPEVIEGFTIRPFAPMRLPTSLTIGPDGDLYATSIPRTGYEPSQTNQVGAGLVTRIHVEHTEAGPVASSLSTAASNLNVPLGIAFDGEDMLVTDKRSNPDAGRENGVVYWIKDDGSSEPIVDGLPIGLHDTNHIEIGPDGRLYIANGSATCNGTAPTLSRQEIAPYNGSFLGVDVAARKGDPATLQWVDGSGNAVTGDDESPLADDDLAVDPINDSFNSKVEVMAHGFRNIFGIAFHPDGTAYTGMNGSQNPASQDVFYRLDAWGEDHSRATGEFGPDYGFPYAFNRTKTDGHGEGGETDGIVLQPNSVYDGVAGAPTDPTANDYVAGDALMGWHVCAVGLDFPSTGDFEFPSEMQTDAFIGECGAYQVNNTVDRTAASRDTRNAGHKVTRVILDGDGQPTEFQDFVSGLGTPTDVEFGPHGVMFIADLNFGVYAVQPTPAAGL